MSYRLGVDVGGTLSLKCHRLMTFPASTPASDGSAVAMPAPHHLGSEAVESRWDGLPAPEVTSASA